MSLDSKNYREYCQKILADRIEIPFCSDNLHMKVAAEELLSNEELGGVVDQLSLLRKAENLSIEAIKLLPWTQKKTDLASYLKRELLETQEKIRLLDCQFNKIALHDKYWNKIAMIYEDSKEFDG